MRKQFHSGNILNKKFHLEMVRDLKADCAKRTEEVCSGFCNIGSGISLKRHEYYCKLPSPISERLIVVTDPMLATGGSAVAAVDFIKQHGGKKIKFMAIIAAPEGVERLMEAHPDIQLYVGHIDRELNKDAYICPGLGDAGDRIFGTK